MRLRWRGVRSFGADFSPEFWALELLELELAEVFLGALEDLLFPCELPEPLRPELGRLEPERFAWGLLEFPRRPAFAPVSPKSSSFSPANPSRVRAEPGNTPVVPAGIPRPT